MRAKVLSSIAMPVLLLGLVVACGHGAATSAPPSPALPDARASSGSRTSGPPQYVVADPSGRGHAVVIALGSGGALGLVVEKTRVVVGRGEPRVGVDLPEQPIGGAAAIPGRLGGGFLFWTDAVVYRSGTFDGPLEPIARVPDSIQRVSFAPNSLLVRTANGERWALHIPSGERRAIEPLGAADVEALDDGRALAFDDRGAAFASTDGGAHWNDVTALLKSAPSRVAVVEGELWLHESTGGALRLERSGQLLPFDKQPLEKPVEMRSRDPRWRGAEAPLRTAFLSGASIDESTAIVVEQGDIVRVDVHTGEIAGVVTGKLPPDARCEAVPTANDVLFACVTRGGAANVSAAPVAFVVSHTLSGEAPTVEQTLPYAAQFYGSDDGGLAFPGSCSGTQTLTVDQAACVRQPGGSWQEFDTSAFTGDGGAGNLTVARWVPRADGSVVALVLDPAPGIFDPISGRLELLEPSARELLGQGLTPPNQGRVLRHMRGGRLPDADTSNLVDWSWSFAANGALRGWQRHGGSVEIAEGGRLTRSPYTFDLVTSGAYALGRTKEGRFYQSIDHGAAWTEVLAPPSSGGPGDLRSCTSAGCDLGGFYRVGWAARAPRIEAASMPARAASEVRRTRPVELSCRPAGPAQSKVLARTGASPDDLGLGSQRLQVASERAEIGFVRNTVARGIVHPLHATGTGESETAAPRAMLTGFATTQDAGVIEVMGPNKNASSLKRGFAFVPPFDPGAPIRSATLAMSEVLAAGREAGMTREEILSEDMTEAGAAIVMTPPDPLSAGDLAFHNVRGLLALVRSSGRVKVAMRPSPNEASVISGVGLGGDEAAFLEVEDSGVGHVFKVGASGTTDLFDVNPTANDASLYPANPDSLAVGPRGELAVIRTGSGSDPASGHDPALLLVPAMPPLALAPWATLRLAGDPSCKEPGWRTTLHVIAPWIRVAGPDLRVEELPMIARVKWSEKRVCLEGVEVKLPDVTVRAPGPAGSESLKVASWLVSRGRVFSRVAIAEGVEWRQPLECTVTAPAIAP